MTAKEKAQELVNKLKPFAVGHDEIVEHMNAKQCALIAVEQLLEHCGGDFAQRFWNEVKTEINNL